MHPEFKRNTNIGVGFGVIGQGAGVMLSTFGLGWLGLVVLLAGLGLFIWGCARYAEGKGHSGWLGALGVLSIIGLVVLGLLPDLNKRPIQNVAQSGESMVAETKSLRGLPIPAAVGVGVVVAGVLASGFTDQGRKLMPREHVSFVLSTMGGPREALTRLCEEGNLVLGMTHEALGFPPRFRPMVSVERRGEVPSKEFDKSVDEISIRLEAPLRVVLSATLPEIRWHSFLPPDFEQVAMPKGSTLALVGECREKKMSWSLDEASTSVPLKYLPQNLRTKRQ